MPTGPYSCTMYDTNDLLDPQRQIEALKQAAREHPQDALAYYNAGVACHQFKELEQAVGYYSEAIALRPELTEALYNLGVAYIQMNAPRKALPLLNRSIAQRPDYAEARFNLGIAYDRCGESKNALASYQQTLRIKPDHVKALTNIGIIHLKNQDVEAARRHFERALRIDPNLADAWFNLAEIDSRAGRHAQAIARYRKAAAIDPVMTAAYNNMGNAYKALQQYAEAIASFKKVIALAPDLAQGHYNLGGAYRQVEDYGKAVAHLSKAIEIEPAYPEAWNNLALTCKNMGDLDRAGKYFDRALQIDPDLAVARWNRSFVNFLRGNWLEGWQDFEARFDVPHWRTIYPHRIAGALWDGSTIDGKTLLVHDEQGLGDTIQFARLLPWARQRCGCLILETRPELIPLLRNCPGIDQIIIRSATQAPAMPFDYYIPLMSLARLAGITPQLLAATPPSYITCDDTTAAKWKPRLPRGRTRVGLVWAGRPQHGNDANRSLKIAQLAPLFRNTDIQFVGLQKGPAASQVEADQWSNFNNIGPSLENFGDTAAVLSHLDLLITVDTAVAHLAGAMGRPVWVLLPFIPDWRWGMLGESTPWYPRMRLYRQHRAKDWQPVIDRISLQLENRQWVDR